MKNKTKVLCLLLALTMLVLFSACGKRDKDAENSPQNSGSSVSSTGVSSENSTASSSDTQGGNTTDTSSTDSTSSGNTASSTVSDTTSSTVSGGTASSDTSSTETEDKSPTVYLKSALNGETVTVTAAIKNNSGLSGFNIKIGYDPKIIEASGFDDVMKLGLASNLMQSTANCNGTVTAVYAAAAGFKTDGDVFSVTFKLIDKNAASTEFKALTEKNSFVNLTVQYVEYKTENVTLNLK